MRIKDAHSLRLLLHRFVKTQGSQRVAARRLGVSQPQLSRYMTGFTRTRVLPDTYDNMVANIGEEIRDCFAAPPMKRGRFTRERIRHLVARYIRTEGCSCCQDVDAHREAGDALGAALGALRFSDDSGVDWGGE